MTTTIRSVLEACKSSKPAKRLLEMADAMDYPVDEMEMEPAGDLGAMPEADVAAAVSSLVTEVIKDPNIDPKATKEKVSKILDVMVDEAPVAEEEDTELEEEESEDEKSNLEESIKPLLSELKSLRDTVAKLQESHAAEASRPRGVRALRESEPSTGTLSDYFKSARR